MPDAPKRAGLPEIRETIPNERLRRRTIDLLEEAFELRQIIQAATLRLKGNDEKGIRGIEHALRDTQIEHGLRGLRYGHLIFVATEQPGKRTLSKDRLLANGCTADIIARSYGQGKSFWKCELVDLEKDK